MIYLSYNEVYTRSNLLPVIHYYYQLVVSYWCCKVCCTLYTVHFKPHLCGQSLQKRHSDQNSRCRTHPGGICALSIYLYMIRGQRLPTLAYLVRSQMDHCTGLAQLIYICVCVCVQCT